MTEARMYTLKEVAKICNVSDYRPKDAIKRGILVPTDIQPANTRYGFKYVFNAQAVRDYAYKLGTQPNFEVVGGEEDEILEDGSIVLTPENFDRIVHGEGYSEQIKSESESLDIRHSEEPIIRNANKTKSSDSRFLRDFAKDHDMTYKDLAFIMDVNLKKVNNIATGHVHLTLDNVMALLVAAKVKSYTFTDIESYFDNDLERLAKIKSWVPIEKAKLMQQYADLQKQMKEIEKQLEEMK